MPSGFPAVVPCAGGDEGVGFGDGGQGGEEGGGGGEEFVGEGEDCGAGEEGGD